MLLAQTVLKDYHKLFRFVSVNCLHVRQLRILYYNSSNTCLAQCVDVTVITCTCAAHITYNNDCDVNVLQDSVEAKSLTAVSLDFLSLVCMAFKHCTTVTCHSLQWP